MSLQVWLPLIKDTNSIGLSAVSGSITNASISYADGKLGKSIRIANYQTTTATYAGITNVEKWSICVWLKINSADTFTNYNDFFTIGMNNGGATAGGFRIEHTNVAGGIQIPVPKLTTYGNTNSWYTFYSNGSCCKDQWAHIAVVCDGTNYYTYINGALASTVAISNFTATTSSLTGTIILGMAGSYCWMNDLRIYDHVLSINEIKEINKGLVLHLPLNNNGLGFFNPNVIKNTANGSGWSCSTFTKSTRIFTRSTTATTESFVQGRADLDNTKTYTMSAEIKTNGQVSSVELFAYDSTVKDIKSKNVGSPTEWTKVFLTFTPNSSYSWTNCNIRFDNNGSKTSGTEAILYVKNIKVEEGSTVTPWCPHTADPEYSSLGFNTTTERDTSGYNCNGTRVGTFVWNTSPTRYGVGTIFGNGGVKSKVYTASNPLYRVNGDPLTVSCWFKLTTRSGYQEIVACRDSSGYNWMIYLHTTDGSIQLHGNAQYKSSVIPSLNEWHHVAAVVYTNQTYDLYLDGTKVVSAVAYNYNAQNPSCINIGAYGTTTTITEPFYGEISDVRVYASSLSADDIKALYSTSASLCNNGVLLSYSFNES